MADTFTNVTGSYRGFPFGIRIWILHHFFPGLSKCSVVPKGLNHVECRCSSCHERIIGIFFEKGNWMVDKDKRQETRNKRLETRNKRQETRNKRQETRNKKQRPERKKIQEMRDPRPGAHGKLDKVGSDGVFFMQQVKFEREYLSSHPGHPTLSFCVQSSVFPPHQFSYFPIFQFSNSLFLTHDFDQT